MTTPQLQMQMQDIRLLGNVPVSQVAGCRCTLLAGDSSISLAGSEEQINFFQQSPKMLKIVSENFIHALLLFLGLFLKISRWVPLTLAPGLVRSGPGLGTRGLPSFIHFGFRFLHYLKLPSSQYPVILVSGRRLERKVMATRL